MLRFLTKRLYRWFKLTKRERGIYSGHCQGLSEGGVARRLACNLKFRKAFKIICTDQLRIFRIEE
jgi:hypothetical protein